MPIRSSDYINVYEFFTCFFAKFSKSDTSTKCWDECAKPSYLEPTLKVNTKASGITNFTMEKGIYTQYFPCINLNYSPGFRRLIQLRPASNNNLWRKNKFCTKWYLMHFKTIVEKKIEIEEWSVGL